MRIAITELAGTNPFVLEKMNAVILAADDGAADGSAPCFARGDNRSLARLAVLVLISIRTKLGANAFEAVVRAARNAAPSVSDVTDAIRE